MEIEVKRKILSTEEIVTNLRAIHSDLQAKHHDEWNWMDADFYVEALHTEILRLKVENQQLRDSVRESVGHDGSCEICGAIPTIQMPYQLCNSCQGKRIA